MKVFGLVCAASLISLSLASPVQISKPVSADSSLDAYLRRRTELVNLDKSFRFSARTQINSDESEVDQILSNLRDIDNAEGSGTALTEISFYDVKEQMRSSATYPLFQALPKGGMLHIHYEALVDPDWLIAEATYEDNCYMYLKSQDKNAASSSTLDGAFKFADARTILEGDGWYPVNYVRESSGLSPEEFDASLIRSITLDSTTCCEGKTAWNKFEQTFQRVNQIIRYKPMFIKHFKTGFEKLVNEQSTQYVEIRTGLEPFYELGLQGEHIYASQEETLLLINEVSEKVRLAHPSFMGFKIIYQAVRFISDEQIRSELDKAVELHTKYPTLVVAFDLVGNEDRGKRLMEYIEPLIEYNSRIPYAFHAGETYEPIGATDNLYDALLLDTHRIGHGFAMLRHPFLSQLVQRIPAGIVVCPVSNQVLGLVANIKNHPVVEMLAAGLPVALSADDPGVFQSDFTDDFWVAFHAWNLSLADLKQLSINSIEYSFMNAEEKHVAFKMLDAEWSNWVQLAKEYKASA
eukprot:TRINITY_DN2240_c0_g1::TRINITY_DN2240_c0_g1_i1::g.6904::m.6904 TRINITY_DN2240_c0_g1::TRINITY_DN2240_c0_g1_i1::g.6904  ORF type:complete len:546 (+),score=192.98,sp/P58780/ADA2_PIG/33.67/7e-76,A_deaminase/PF00962.17/1.9e-54,A_deaminase_N/PF08451.6/1e-05,Glyco_trans_1_4/PF13692.1/4.4e+02,Glyco_trans_1_4/PF13692.1/0.78 TRINITY_DN2240_c0_g1_i1:76-1638(+)